MNSLTRRAPELIAVPLAVGLGFALATTGGRGAAAIMAAATLTVAVGLFATASRARSRNANGDFLLNVSLALLGFAVLAITFNGLRVTAGLAVADVAIVASAGAALLHFIVAKKAIPAPPWLVLAGTGILVAGVISAAGQADFGGNLIPAVRFTIALVLTPVLIGALTDGDGPRRLIIGAWVLSAAVNAAVGLSDFVGLTDVSSRYFPVNSTGRINALTSHPNHLGLVCAMAIPMVFWGLRTAGGVSPFGRSTNGVLLAILASGVYISGSRAALIATVGGCVLVVLLAARRARGAVIVIAFFAIALAIVLTLSTFSIDQTGDPNVFERLSGGDPGAQASDAERLTALAEAQGAFTSKPVFGEGFKQLRGAHDIYLQLLQAGGLAAFVAFSVFAFGTLRLGRALGRGAKSSHDLAGALTAAVAVWLLAGLFQNAIYDRYLYVPAGLLLGLAAASQRNDERRGRLTASFPTRSSDLVRAP